MEGWTPQGKEGDTSQMHIKIKGGTKYERNPISCALQLMVG